MIVTQGTISNNSVTRVPFTRRNKIRRNWPLLVLHTQAWTFLHWCTSDFASPFTPYVCHFIQTDASYMDQSLFHLFVQARVKIEMHAQISLTFSLVMTCINCRYREQRHLFHRFPSMDQIREYSFIIVFSSSFVLIIGPEKWFRGTWEGTNWQMTRRNKNPHKKQICEQ